MCEKCEQNAAALPGTLVTGMAALQPEYDQLMSRIGAVLLEAGLFHARVVEVEGDKTIAAENLSESDKSLAAHAMENLTRIVGASYALGFYGSRECMTDTEARENLSCVGRFLGQGSHDSLVLGYVAKKVRN